MHVKIQGRDKEAMSLENRVEELERQMKVIIEYFEGISDGLARYKEETKKP